VTESQGLRMTVAVQRAQKPGAPISLAYPPLCVEGTAGQLCNQHLPPLEVPVMPVGRYILSAKFVLDTRASGVCDSHAVADFSPDTAMHTIVWTSMLQGLGLGFMFVPLNTIALATVPVALRTQGTAMWTLIRNLGSSIGVSIVIANLTNKTIMMRAHLAESITPFNQALADPGAAMLDPATDTGRALLENLITQQATIIAYANDFKLMMVATLLVLPLIVLFRTSKHDYAAAR